MKIYSTYIRKLTCIIAVVMALWVVLSCGHIYAAPLKVGCIWYPPFYVIDREGDKVTKIRGINVEVVKKVLDRMGETYKIEFYPAKRLYSNLEKGSTHVFYGLRAPEAVVPSSAILHSKNKISKVFLRVYSIEDTPAINDRYDLINKRLIVFRGHGYGGFIDFIMDPENKITTVAADTQENAFKMLKKRRADYLLAPELPAMHAINLLPRNYLPRLKWSPKLAHADGYFVISRKAPNAEELRDRMDAAYQELLAEGAFDELKHFYKQ